METDTLVRRTDNLVRARYDQGAAELRADGEGGGRTLFGHFAVFDTWTEIDSWYEGRFLERVASGSFTETFKNKSGIRVLFEHGRDPSIGNKPIASPDVLREDAEGAYHESPLFTDANYVQELMPALRAKQLGASFRFKVTDEEWIEPKTSTTHNPGKLPERTIRAVDLYEYGPVTWGAYPEATSGVRSGTDSFIDQLLHDPLFLARMVERTGLPAVEQILSGVPEALRALRANTPDVVQQDTSAPTHSATDIRLALAAFAG